MHVLVTGSAGRIGKRVVAQLLDRGDTVTGFDLKGAGVSDPRYDEIVGGFENPRLAAKAIKRAEAVVHLGALMSWLPADSARVMAANATSSLPLLAAAAATGKLQRFVLASTGEVYPEGKPRYEPIDEDHPCEPISTYGLSKLITEEAARFFHRTQGLPVTILRFAHTQDASELLDPESFFSGPRFYLRAKIRQQQAFGNARALAVLEPLDNGREQLLIECSEEGVPYRMMIADARDIADGVILALDSPRAVGATLNLGPDEAIAFDDAVACLEVVTGLPVVRARMPGPPVNYSTSNARARDLLGFRPRWTFATMVTDAKATSASR
ncbi:MAG: NAD(P)-dependent oxidoreductase [Betaproteobacteria bacterium]